MQLFITCLFSCHVLLKYLHVFAHTHTRTHAHTQETNFIMIIYFLVQSWRMLAGCINLKDFNMFLSLSHENVVRFWLLLFVVMLHLQNLKKHVWFFKEDFFSLVFLIYSWKMMKWFWPSFCPTLLNPNSSFYRNSSNLIHLRLVIHFKITNTRRTYKMKLLNFFVKLNWSIFVVPILVA